MEASVVEVWCSVLIVLGTGERVLVDAKGFMGDESGDSILVHFQDNLGEGTSAKWVRENDCQYLGDVEKNYQDYLRTREIADKIALEDQKKWKNIIEQLNKGNKK